MSNLKSIRQVLLGNGSVEEQIQAAYRLSQSLEVSVVHHKGNGVAQYNALNRSILIAFPDDHVSTEMYLKNLFFGLTKAMSEIAYGEIGV